MSFTRKQQIYFDGVEESFKFVRIAYSRIVASIMSQDPADDEVDSRSDILILDAWTIIDLAKRIRTLLENMPGLKGTPELRVFMDRTSDVPRFRHYIQHLESEAQDVAATGKPIWGSISWARLLPDKRFVIGMYAPGRLAKCKGIPVVNPAGRQFHADVDHIELSVDSQTVNVSALVRDIGDFANRFSGAVRAAEESGVRDKNGLIRFELPTKR